jgi:hypothetical protein
VQTFIFLEFTDPRIRKFLEDLRATLEGENRGERAHITIRGPYSDIPDTTLLEQLDEEVRGHGVVIGGAGTFTSKKKCIVYLKVQSPLFNEVWWKPDFPSHKFGIKPHVSVFETVDMRMAKAVEAFLRTERIEIFTFGLQLSIHTSKQLELFRREASPDVSRRLWTLGRWNVKPGILLRARKLRQSLVERE